MRCARGNVVDQTVADRFDAAGTVEHAPPHQHAATGRCRGPVLRPVDRCEGVKLAEEEYERRDQQALPEMLAI
jgi:hypothetical protein